MDELDSIINDLSSIINQLRDVEAHLRSDFQGIGTEKCADIVSAKADDLIKAKNRLYSVDRSKIDK